MCSVQYIGRCSVHRRDIMSTSGGYHEYIGGISWVRRGDMMMHVGDRYHEYIGIFNINQRLFMNLLPHMNHDISPMYSRYPSDVLMVSPPPPPPPPRCTEHTLYRVATELHILTRTAHSVYQECPLHIVYTKSAHSWFDFLWSNTTRFIFLVALLQCITKYLFRNFLYCIAR